MAEDKKSFILYADLIHTVCKLPNDKAGELFKHILEYVNDKDPITEDLVIQISFEPIKQQLKRDLIKWEEAKGGQSTGGIIGNLKRWHPDIYTKYKNQEITLEEAQSIATNRTQSDTDNTPSLPIGSIAVTVNASDSVNVTDTKTPLTPKKGKDYQNVDFSFVEEDMKDAFRMWLTYKKERGQKYKGQKSLEACYKLIKTLSDGNKQKAIEIVEYTMGQNFAGLVKQKKENSLFAQPQPIKSTVKDI